MNCWVIKLFSVSLSIIRSLCTFDKNTTDKCKYMKNVCLKFRLMIKDVTDYCAGMNTTWEVVKIKAEKIQACARVEPPISAIPVQYLQAKWKLVSFWVETREGWIEWMSCIHSSIRPSQVCYQQTKWLTSDFHWKWLLVLLQNQNVCFERPWTTPKTTNFRHNIFKPKFLSAP